MKIVESILYIVFIALAFLKSFAISIQYIQTYSVLGIFFLSIFSIVLNYKILLNDKVIIAILLYLFSLCLSSTYIFERLTFPDFLNSLLFPLLFLTSYVYFYKYPEYFKFVKYVGGIALILAYYNLLRLSALINLRSTHLLQSNAGNTLVALLPFAVLWRNKIVKYALFGLVFVGSLIAIKRSAFLIYIACVFCYLVFSNQQRLSVNIIKYVLILIFVGIVILPEIDMAQSLLDRLSGISEDGGSGRDSLFKYGIELQSHNDFTEWIIGTGFRGGHYEMKLHQKNFTCFHNDYIEILFDAGIIAYLIYLYIITQFVLKSKQLFDIQSPYLVPFVCCIIVIIGANMLVCSYVHYWYYLPIFCLLGSIYSLIKNDIEI